MVGQEKLVSKIKNCSLGSLPKAILLCGPTGSGKHTIANMLATQLNIEILDVSDNISLSMVNEAYGKVSPIIYLIDCNEITVKEQNTILKFIEEPPKMVYVMLLCNVLGTLIETIQNRCTVWDMEPYSIRELREFTTNESILPLCKTPGDIKVLQDYDTTEWFELANKIFSNIMNASLCNTLTLLDKVAFKGEKDKIPVRFFMNVLLQVSHDLVISQKLPESAYFLTNEITNQCNGKSFNMEYLFAKYLIELRELLQDGN